MSYSDEVLADGPIAYWKLDEASGNWADSSGGGFTATVTGDPVYRQPGPSHIGGFSVGLDDVVATDYGAAEVTSVNTTSGAEVMVEMWFNWRGDVAASGSSELFAFVLPGDTNYAIWIRYDTGIEPNPRLGFNTYNNDAYGITTVGNIAAGFWYMGNFAFKEGARDSCRMWINGVEKSPLSDTQVVGAATAFDPTCLVGAGAGAPAQHGFTGYLAQVSLYNRWLSQERIDAHWDVGNDALRARHGVGMGCW